MSNPFRLLRSERISSDHEFLRLFGMGLLESLMEKRTFSQNEPTLILQSSPGGGKTSLLRLLTPSVLKLLEQHKTSPEFQALYALLRERISAFNETGSSLLGVYLPIDSSYSEIRRLGLPEKSWRMLLGEFLDARLGIQGLSAIAELANLDFPLGLKKVKMKPINGGEEYSSAHELFIKLSEKEQWIFSMIDHTDKASILESKAPLFLSSAKLLMPENVHINGKRAYEKAIFMLDDAHLLGKGQLGFLLSELIQAPSHSFIISLRSEAMQEAGLVLSGAREQRDYIHLYIEDYWRSFPSKFYSALESVADKRVRDAREVQINSFRACVDSMIENPVILKKVKKKQEDTKQDIIDLIGDENIAEEVITGFGDLMGDHYEQLVELRAVKILIERKLRHAQRTLVPPDDPKDFVSGHVDSSLRAASRLFIAKEEKVPCYFGFEEISRLSSFNIEQFLNLASSIFEFLMAQMSLGGSSQISPGDQHRLIVEHAEKRWNSIPQTVSHGYGVQGLIKGIAGFCSQQTFRPNAPYAPGVSGVALRPREFALIMDQSSSHREKWHKELSVVIRSCLIENILEKKIIAQGKPSREHVVLYLNRLLGVIWLLPVNYGGWRIVRARQLHNWMYDGYEKQSGVLGI